MATNSIIEKVTSTDSSNNRIASTFYCTCSTAAGTKQKDATPSDSCVFNDSCLITGVTVFVKFAETNTNGAATLKVGTSSAKSIKCFGTTATGQTETGSWYAGSVVSFTYDGTNWIQNDYKYNTTYTFAGGTNKFTVTPSGGTAQDVTITPSIADNITGTGTSGYIAKFNSTNTITNGPAFGSSTTTYLNNAGSWTAPSLDSLSNVTISNPTSGQPLVYDADEDEWVNSDYIIESIDGNIIQDGTIPGEALSPNYTDSVQSDIQDAVIEVTNGYTTADNELSQVINATINQNVAAINSNITSIQTNVTTLAESISAKVTGSNNKIQNSSGLNGVDSNWTYAGNVTASQGSVAQDNTTSGSMFVLTGAASPNYAQLVQEIKVIRGKTYTFSFKARQTTSSRCYVQLIGAERTITVFDSTAAFGWTEFNAKDGNVNYFTASGDSVTIKAYALGSELDIADLMLVEGNTLSSWAPSPNEIYTTNVKVDKAGIKINNTANSTRTVINNEEISVYNNNNNKIFGISNNTTNMNRGNVSNDLTIGKGRFIPFNYTETETYPGEGELRVYNSGLNFIILD